MGKITWIKDGKLTTKRELSYYLFGKDEVIDHSLSVQRQIVISKKIELLHLKNMSFDNFTVFECSNPDTILILENCILGNEVEFVNGNVVLEQPKSEETWYGNTHIHFRNNQSVELHLADDKRKDQRPQKMKYQLRAVRESALITGDARKSSIWMGDSSKTIRLEQVEGLCIERIEADRVEIKDSEVELKSDLLGKDAFIKNSKIDAKATMDGFYFGGHNLEIQAPTTIEGCQMNIGGMTCNSENGIFRFKEDGLGNGDLSVARVKLLSSFKTIGEEAENHCRKVKRDLSAQIEQKYEKTMSCYQRWLEEDQEQKEYYERQIAKDQALINDLESKKETVVNNIDQCLKKQKVGPIIAGSKR